MGNNSNIQTYKSQTLKLLILSFLLNAFAKLLFLFAGMSASPEAGHWLEGDTLEQYIPAIREMVRNVWNGQSLFYSWNLYLGMNAMEAYSTYAGGSVINILLFLLPSLEPEVFFEATLVLKGGITGACFSYYAKKVLHTSDKSSLIWSLFYSLCAFQVTTGLYNYVWLDALYLLPLLITFQLEFLTSGKWKKLAITYAYLFLCHFYSAYMVGMYTAFFFVTYVVLYLLVNKNREVNSSSIIYRERINTILKKSFHFAFIVIFAVGIAAVGVLPVAEFLLTKKSMDVSQADPSLVQQNLGVLLSRFSYGIEWLGNEKRPYLYCGIPVIMLVPVYFLSKNISVREKVFSLISLLLLLGSCMFLPLYMFWHGFDAPDMWYGRFVFLISFVCISIACRSYDVNKDLSIKKKVVYGGAIFILLNLLFTYGLLKTELFSQKVFGAGMVISLIWLIIYMLRPLNNDKRKKIWVGICFVLAITEVISNGRLQNQCSSFKEEEYIWKLETNSALEILKQDDSFYRVNYENEYMINSDTYWGYHGISDFWTYENYELRLAMEKLGAVTSPAVLQGIGMNPVTQLILGVKYCIRASGSQSLEEAGATVTQYPRALGLGFLVSDQIKSFYLGEENIYENNNALAQSMAGKEVIIFEPVPEEKIMVRKDGIVIGKQEDFYFLQGDENKEGLKQFTYVIPWEGKEAYITFQGYNGRGVSNSPQIFNYQNVRDKGNFGIRYSKKMDIVDGEQICTILMENNKTLNLARYKELQLYYANEEEIEKFYQRLSNYPLDIVDYKNGYVKGSVFVPSTDKILFTSIPYDKWWKVTAKDENNRPVKVQCISLIDGAFLGVEFEKEGLYQLEFRYSNPFHYIAIAISSCSVLLFVVICISSKDSRNLKKCKGYRYDNIYL